jgi:predicted nucleic acid-binding protein
MGSSASRLPNKYSRESCKRKFLEMAISSEVECIVSGDKDLLILHPFRGIPILNAADFLTNFEKPSSIRRKV